MTRDVRDQVAQLGPIDAILIGGDIAFKADPQEYAAAMEWIRQLVGVSGCNLERVYVIPGNHDIDRSVVRNSLAVRNAQAAIHRAEPSRREGVLRAQFEDPDTGGALLRPLAAYNEFAKVFNCQIYSPDRLYWKQTLPLEGGVRLRLNGLTSTILSGTDGNDDKRMELYLSPMQTGLDPEDDVVNLVIAHHPPDWCMDHDDIEQDLNDRAVLHLFGHKHRQTAVLADRHIRIGAAAVNPDRYEAGFEPGYNLINLAVNGAGVDRTLDVQIHMRHLQRSPEQYRSRLNGQDPVYRRQIAIPEQVTNFVPTPRAADAFNVLGVIETVPPAIVSAPNNAESVMSDEPTRNLVYRFWQLTISQRRTVANKLGIIEVGEMALPEPERYGRALQRAGERDLLGTLASEIAKLERK
jgi:hypothetical protein